MLNDECRGQGAGGRFKRWRNRPGCDVYLLFCLLTVLPIWLGCAVKLVLQELQFNLRLYMVSGCQRSICSCNQQEGS